MGSVRSVSDVVARRVGDIVGGKYKLERQLGEGGMGVVFSALHLGTGRRVALKCMARPANMVTAYARFKREAQAAGRIDHPNVVQVFDVGEDERGRFIVMEFLRGESLGELLHRARLPAAAAIDLMLPALRGVHAAHKQGVLHRDLKPDNIFISRSEEGGVTIKVLDFGVSKLTLENDDAENLTRTGVLLGTPQYMPPERIGGRATNDKRTDVYALGVILYEALTGRRPFDGEAVPELVARISCDHAPPLRQFEPSIPAGLEAVVLKAMARRPEERFDDVQQLALALEPFAGEERFIVRGRDPTLGLLSTESRLSTPHREIPATQTWPVGGLSRLSPQMRIGGAAALFVLLALALWFAVRPSEPPLASDAQHAQVPSVAAPVSVSTPSPAAAANAAAAQDRGAPIPTRSASEDVPARAGAERPADSSSAQNPRSRAASAERSVDNPPAPSPRPKAAGAPRPARKDAARSRVARGVRTGGLSEQDF